MEIAQTPEEVNRAEKTALSAPSAAYGQFTAKAAEDVNLVEPAEINDSGSKSPLPQRTSDQRAAVERRIARTSPMYQGVMRKALEGSAPPRGAIKAFCIHCVGDVRAEVTNCSAITCPLWVYRPYQQQAGAADSEAADA